MPELSVEEFANRLLEIIPLLMREFFRNQIKEISKGLITFPQFLIMDYLIRHRESQMKDIARFMDVTMATTTGIVDRIVREGYARRIFDSGDRRIIKIALTAKGNKLAQRIRQARRNVIINVFDKISPDDRREYLRILNQVQEALKK